MTGKAMIIAGSDSGAGAGIQTDLKTFSAFGVYATTVLTLLTAQNTIGIKDALIVDPLMVSSQIDAIMTDIGADAVKVGVIPSVECSKVVAEKLVKYKVKNIVLDTVMVSTSGYVFGGKSVTQALIDYLFPIVDLVTPNINETTALSSTVIKTLEDLKQSIRIIHDRGAKMIVSTGWVENKSSIDVFFDGKDFQIFESPLVVNARVHGAGCTFSSAIAANLAQGFGIKESVEKAKDYVTKAIEKSFEIGKGLRPLNHFNWRTHEH